MTTARQVLQRFLKAKVGVQGDVIHSPRCR